jgi:hypothetical protein
MRLNFSNARPEQIEVGIRRLGEVLAAEMKVNSHQLSVVSRELNAEY